MSPPGPLPAGRGRLRLWLTLAVVASSLAAAVAFVGSGPDRDPDEALAAAQLMVGQATSFRFSLSLDAHGFDIEGYRDAVVASSDEDGFEDGDLPEVGDGTISTVGGGEFASPDWHATGATQFGADEWHAEAILRDGVLYQRYGSDAEDLAESEYWADEHYVEEQLDREEVLEDLAEARDDLPFSVGAFPDVAAQIDAFFAAQLYLSGFGDQLGSDVEQDPRGYLDAVAALADPSVARTDGDRLTLGVHMTPSKDVERLFGGELPPADIELDLDGDDQPLALRMVLGAAGMELRIELAFADWGADIQIDAPAEDELEDHGYDEVGDELDPDAFDEGSFEDVDGPDGYQHFEDVGEAIESPDGDGRVTSRRSALTGDELRQLDVPSDLGLIRPTQVGDGLRLEQVVLDQVGDCTTVTIWYEGADGYLVVWLSQERCTQGSRPDAVLGGTAVRIDTDDPDLRATAIDSLEAVTVDQLAQELDAAR